MGVLSDSLGKKKPKGFGQRPSRGSFGKKKTRMVSKAKKIKKTDIIDKNYSAWLRGQACVITGKVGSCHAHHIFGRYPSQNDYLQVPLVHYVHNIAPYSLHECGSSDFIEHWEIDLRDCENIKEYFYSMVSYFIKKYEDETDIKIDRDKLKRN